MHALPLPFRDRRVQPWEKTVSAARSKCWTLTFTSLGFKAPHKFPSPSPTRTLPGRTRFSHWQPKPLHPCSLSWGTTLQGRAKVSQNAACRPGCCRRGEMQFVPVQLMGSAHASLMGSNWLRTVSLASHVGCSCLSTQKSDAEGSAGNSELGQDGSFCPKKHSWERSSSDEQCWQGSKDAGLWKTSSFPRLELFWTRIESGLLKNVFVWKNSVFVCAR